MKKHHAVHSPAGATLNRFTTQIGAVNFKFNFDGGVYAIALIKHYEQHSSAGVLKFTETNLHTHKQKVSQSCTS